MRNFEVGVPGPSARDVVETRLGRFPARRFHGQAGPCCNFEFILYLHIPSAYMSCRFVDFVYYAFQRWNFGASSHCRRSTSVASISRCHGNYLTYRYGEKSLGENMKDLSSQRVEPITQNNPARCGDKLLQSSTLYQYQVSPLQSAESVRVCRISNYGVLN